ncbi:MAG: hypothetical protein VX835_03865 [Pseudomonadota bacterium]|nr:hypothetical protein [Pseudomonadota bacterium]
MQELPYKTNADYINYFLIHTPFFLMSIPFSLYIFVRLTLNILIQSINIGIQAINFYLGKLEQLLVKKIYNQIYSITWIINDEKDIQKKPTYYGLLYFVYVLNFLLKIIQLCLTLTLLMPFHLISNFFSLVAKKISLPKGKTIHHYLKFLENGALNDVIYDEKVFNFAKIIKFFIDIDESVDNRLNQTALRFNSSDLNRKLKRIFFITNLMSTKSYLSARNALKYGVSTILTFFQNSIYFLSLGPIFILNIWFITVPFIASALVSKTSNDSLLKTDCLVLFAIYLNIPMFIFGKDAVWGTPIEKLYDDEAYAIYLNKHKNYYGILYQTINVIKYFTLRTIDICCELTFISIQYIVLFFQNILSVFNHKHLDYRNTPSTAQIESKQLANTTKLDVLDEKISIKNLQLFENYLNNNNDSLEMDLNDFKRL